jgi:hypothetical protein
MHNHAAAAHEFAANLVDDLRQHLCLSFWIGRRTSVCLVTKRI